MLLSVFFLHTALMVGYVGYFYAYRTQIAAKYCLNKTNAKSNCHGCCHLTKTIQKMNPQDVNSHENAAPVFKNVEFEWLSLGSIVKCQIGFVFDSKFPEKKSLTLSDGAASIELPPPRC
jgi:hypothetical protein